MTKNNALQKRLFCIFSALCLAVAIVAVCTSARVKAQAEEPFVAGYFDTTNAALAVDGSGMHVTFSQENNAVTFNKDVADRFARATFHTVDGKTKYAKVQFMLTDSADASKKVNITYYKSTRNPKVTTVRINDKGEQGDSEVKLPVEFAAGRESLSFVYDKDAKRFTTESGTMLGKITKYYNGEAFEGFPSCKVEISMYMSGVTGESEVRLVNMASQPLNSYVTRDNRGPLVYLSGGFPSVMYLNAGDVFRVPAIEAFDTFSDVKSVNITVSSDSETLYSGDGSTEHEVTLSGKGTYSATYTVTDTLGNQSSQMCVINVRDTASPVITLKKEKDTATAGKLYTVQQAAVQCNNEYTLYVYVINGDGGRDAVDDGETYTFKKAGKYTVCYYVVDEYDNIARATYTVEVKA